MKEVKAYEARNGKLFDNPKDCENYESELYLEEWYADNPLHCEWGHTASLYDLKDYLRKHKDKFKFIFSEG